NSASISDTWRRVRRRAHLPPRRLNTPALGGWRKGCQGPGHVNFPERGHLVAHIEDLGRHHTEQVGLLGRAPLAAGEDLYKVSPLRAGSDGRVPRRVETEQVPEGEGVVGWAWPRARRLHVAVDGDALIAACRCVGGIALCQEYGAAPERDRPVARGAAVAGIEGGGPLE